MKNFIALILLVGMISLTGFSSTMVDPCKNSIDLERINPPPENPIVITTVIPTDINLKQVFTGINTVNYIWRIETDLYSIKKQITKKTGANSKINHKSLISIKRPNKQLIYLPRDGIRC